MRILDPETGRSLRELQMYFTPSEAAEFREALNQLLTDPEAMEHRHVIADGREISFSLVTPAKLANLKRYTEAERRVLQER
jgi:hypothetical protein